jgi:hypothetical protein
MNIQASRENRFNFLKKVYDLCDGNENTMMNMWGIGNALGLEREETDKITQFLVGENLIKFVALGGELSITHYGVIKIEEAVSKPEKETQYFPPVNIINIHHMENSQIQQNNISSTQESSWVISNNNDIRSFLEILKTKIHELNLSSDDELELNSEVATIESQLSSSRPKKGIIKETLLSIKKIIEGAAGGIVAGELLKYIPTLLTYLK